MITTETTEIYTLTNTASTITTSGNLTINTIDNINIIGSNITTEGNINLTTEEGSVNVVAVVDVDSSYHEYTNQDLISSSIDIVGSNLQTVVGSNIISGGDINIDSGNDINIVGSNLEGVNGILTASGDINILSLAQINTYMDYHKEQSMDFTAVLIGAALAATGVGAAVAVGILAVEASLAVATTAALVGAGAGTQVQVGESDKYTTVVAENISSNLNFENSITLTTQEGDINITASNLTAEESITINLNGENSSLNLTSLENTTTTVHEHETIKPNYLTFGAAMFGYGFVSGIIPTVADKLDFALTVNSVNITGAGGAAGLGIGMIGGTNIITNPHEESKPTTTGTSVSISINLSKPEIYGDIWEGTFTLINPNVLDIDKPLKPNIFNIYNATTTTTTTVDDIVKPTLNTNNLVINVNKP